MENHTTKFSKVLIVSAVVIYSVSLVMYAMHFGGHGFSADTSVWGQFGDFMGGAVNPILGMITIWFLAVTLKQSEFSHEQQIQFAAEVRDFEVCVELITYYEKSAQDLLTVAREKAQLFELGASNSINTLNDTPEDQSVLEKLSDLKTGTYRDVRATEEKAQVFFDLANALKPMLQQAHTALVRKYIKK